MKKKFLGLILALGLIVTAQEAVTAMNHGNLSDLTMENVDALTETEKEPLHYKLVPCYSSTGAECVWTDNPKEADCPSATYCR